MSNPNHDLLMAKIVGSMKSNSFTQICVDHTPGYTQPADLGGFRPDATGLYGTRLCIIEAESHEGLSEPHTKEQITAFLTAARRKQGLLIVAVFKTDEALAAALLKQIGATGDDSTVWAY